MLKPDGLINGIIGFFTSGGDTPEEFLQNMEEKQKEQLYETNVRFVVSAPTKEKIDFIVNSMKDRFEQFKAHKFNNFNFVLSKIKIAAIEFTFKMFKSG